MPDHITPGNDPLPSHVRVPEASVFAALASHFKRVDGAPLIAVAKETMTYTSTPMWVLIFGEPPAKQEDD